MRLLPPFIAVLIVTTSTFAISVAKQPGIPEDAFRGSCTIASRSAGAESNTFLARRDNTVGLFSRDAIGVLPNQWNLARDRDDAKVFSIHGWTLNETTLKSTVEKSAIVYSLKGDDVRVRYRVPDENAGKLWRRIRPRNEKTGARAKYDVLQAVEGEFKGWYLNFRDDTDELTGPLGDPHAYHAPYLSREPGLQSRLRIGEGHSGVSP
jgi:hypothetical protein